MNYIDLINSFWDLATTNPLSTGQVSLYFALVHICNRSYWTEWFQAPNQVLTVLTGLSRSGIQKARNELKQRGLLDFRERGTKPTVYKLITKNNVQTDVSMSNSNQVSVQDGVQVGNQVSVQDSVQDSTRTDVSMSNSNQNGVQDSVQANNSYINNINILKQKTKDIPPVSSVMRFEEFLLAYPKNSNRHLTEKAYVDLLLTGRITEGEMIKCAQNYAEYCTVLAKEERYRKNAENFLRDYEFEKYLPENYQKPQKKIKNQFNNFEESSSYDMQILEQQIMENGGGV